MIVSTILFRVDARGTYLLPLGLRWAPARCRSDGKPFVRILLGDQFPVVLEDDVGRVARLKRHLRRVLDFRDPVADVGMSQTVVPPRDAQFLRQVCGRTGSLRVGRHFAFARKQLEPTSQIVRDGHDATGSRFRLVRTQHDDAAIQIRR